MKRKIFYCLILTSSIILSGSSLTKQIIDDNKKPDVNSGVTNSNENINNGNTFIPEDSESIEDSNENVTPPVDNKKTIFIYLNPSVQTKNFYYGNLGTEAQHMQDIAHIMYEELKNIPYIDVDCNTYFKTLSLKEGVAESNSKHRHIHFALHSNAGGGSGTEVYTKDSIEFATKMYNTFLTLGNFNKRGVKVRNTLYETNNSKAEHTALMEFLFHDRKDEALYLVNNKKTIANTMVKGLIEFINENYW
ncbi:MAG: N-acetylmuramoyl-L-alanine amidase [Bacilli bacterium]|nr:N-acetylmuramoyl-L-alanine amidase [Bacilli bacterium]